MEHLVIVRYNGEVSLDTSCKCPVDDNGDWVSAVFLKGNIWIDSAGNVSTTTMSVNATHKTKVDAVMFLTGITADNARRLLAGECIGV